MEMPSPVVLAVVGALLMLVIGLFTWWTPRRADGRAVAAERERIRRVAAQPQADKGSDQSENEP